MSALEQEMEASYQMMFLWSPFSTMPESEQAFSVASSRSRVDQLTICELSGDCPMPHAYFSLFWRRPEEYSESTYHQIPRQ